MINENMIVLILLTCVAVSTVCLRVHPGFGRVGRQNSECSAFYAVLVGLWYSRDEAICCNIHT